jgi:hypothetical protein
MSRQGYPVSLSDHGAGQWIAVFYAGQQIEAAGTARAPTPWAAVQRAALTILAKGALMPPKLCGEPVARRIHLVRHDQ